MFQPTLRQLRYLIAIHETKSFIKAADECAVTQGTISAAIRDLENGLEQTLVVRGRKEATLTPLGLEILDSARRMMAESQYISRRAKQLKSPLTGPLRLGIIPTIAPYIMPEILSKFSREFPLLEMQLHEDLTDRLLEALKKSAIDVALLAFPYNTPGMHQKLLYEEPFYAAIAQKHAHDKYSIHIKDLEPEKLLLLEDGHCLRDHAISACALQLPRRRKTFSATSLPSLIQMVRAGYGMTLLPEMACKKGALPDGITLLPFSGKQKPTRKIGLCWKEKDPRAPDYETLAKSLL